MRPILVILLLSLSLSSATHTDMLGRSVTLQKADRIVCIGPGALRLATYMGLEKRLVGIEKTESSAVNRVPYRKKIGSKLIRSLPVIGQGGPAKLPNLEALIAAGPDLVFASFLDPEQIALITHKTHIPVVALSYGGSYGGKSGESKLAAVSRSLALMGEITGTQTRAQTLGTFIKEQQTRLASLDLPPVRPYIAGIGYKGAQGFTSTESDYPPFMLLGLRNALLEPGRVGHLFVQEEAILKADPEAVFLDLTGRTAILEEQAKKAPLFNALRAYKNKRVHWLLPYNFYNTNIENLFVDAWTIAEKLGADAAAEKESEAVYETFLGKNGKAILHTFLPLPEVE